MEDARKTGTNRNLRHTSIHSKLVSVDEEFAARVYPKWGPHGTAVVAVNISVDCNVLQRTPSETVEARLVCLTESAGRVLRTIGLLEDTVITPSLEYSMRNGFRLPSSLNPVDLLLLVQGDEAKSLVKDAIEAVIQDSQSVELKGVILGDVHLGCDSKTVNLQLSPVDREGIRNILLDC